MRAAILMRSKSSPRDGAIGVPSRGCPAAVERTWTGTLGRASRSAAMIAALSFGWAATGSAVVTTFSGVDLGPGAASNAAIPNSQSAEANFKTAAGALGPVTTIDLESVPVNVPVFNANLALGNGVTATLAGTFTQATTGVTAAVALNPPGVGFNTTPGGSRYLELDINVGTSPASVTINFPQPIQAFGAFVGGVGTGLGIVDVTFDDGTMHSIPVPAPVGIVGGMQYVGFTDPGAAIIAVTLREVGNAATAWPTEIDDSFSLDDISYVVSSTVHAAPVVTVPAVSSPMLAALALVLLALGAGSARRRRG
jgi:hypothetical protein